MGMAKKQLIGFQPGPDQTKARLCIVAVKTGSPSVIPHPTSMDHPSNPMKFVDIENSRRSCSTNGCLGPKLRSQAKPGRRGERSSTSEANLLASRRMAGKTALLKKFSWCVIDRAFCTILYKWSNRSGGAPPSATQN